MILGKNPNHLKKGLYIDTIEFRIMQTPDGQHGAARGEIDFIMRVPMQQVPLLEKSQGVTRSSPG